MAKRVMFAALILVAATCAFAQDLIRYPVSGNPATNDFPFGRVVRVTGSGEIDTTAVGRDAAGVIVGKEQVGVNFYYLVATAGIIQVTLPAGIVAGDRLTVGGEGEIVAATNPEDVLIGIAMEDGGGVAMVQLLIADLQAQYTAYTGIGGLTGDVTNVQEAIDSLTIRSDDALANAFVNGGNAFGIPAVLGTNDNFGLTLETNNSPRMSINNVGDILMYADNNPVRVRQHAGATTDGVFDVFATESALNYGLYSVFTAPLGAGEQNIAIATRYRPTSATIIGGDEVVSGMGGADNLLGINRVAGVFASVVNAGVPQFYGGLSYQNNDGASVILNAAVYGNAPVAANSFAGYFDGTVRVDGTTVTVNFTMTSGAANNYLMVSDAVGNGTWTSAAAFNGFILNQAPDGVFATGQTADFDVVGNAEIGGTLDLGGTFSLNSVGAGLATDALITRDPATGEIRAASAATMLDGSYFRNGGNTFGAPAIIGTNDAENLEFETGGTTHMILGTDGVLNMNNNRIENIGAAGTDFTATGGLTLADVLTLNNVPDDAAPDSVLTIVGGQVQRTSLSGLGVRWDAIIDPAANQTLDMAAYTTDFGWVGATGNLFRLTTDATSGAGTLLDVQGGAGSTIDPLRVRAGAVEGLMVDDAGDVLVGVTAAPGGAYLDPKMYVSGRTSINAGNIGYTNSGDYGAGLNIVSVATPDAANPYAMGVRSIITNAAPFANTVQVRAISGNARTAGGANASVTGGYFNTYVTSAATAGVGVATGVSADVEVQAGAAGFLNTQVLVGGRFGADGTNAGAASANGIGGHAVGTHIGANFGVSGIARSGGMNVGVAGVSTASDIQIQAAFGALAALGVNAAVYGYNPSVAANNYAGLFDGNVAVTGTSLLSGNVTAIANVGVGGNLAVTGTTNLIGVTTMGTGVTNYTLPNTRGADGQILVTNGAGAVTWQDAGAGLGQTTGQDVLDAPVNLTVAAWTDIATLSVSPTLHGNGTIINFTGTIKDNNGATGAHVIFRIVDGVGAVSQEQEVVIVPSSYFQTENIAITCRVSAVGAQTYTVQYQVVNAAYNSGRLTSGTITYVEVND